MLNKKRGFTLIELLVAISIVVVLSAVGVTSYRAAHKSGRDGKRKSDLNQIRSALEMYRSDEGLYPNINDGTGANWSGMIGTLTTDGFIGTAPLDPRSDDGWVYYYNSVDGYTYIVCALLESDIGGTCAGNPDCTGDSDACNYQLSNP